MPTIPGPGHCQKRLPHRDARGLQAQRLLCRLRTGSFEAGVFGWPFRAARGSEDDDGIEVHRGAESVHPEAGGGRDGWPPRAVRFSAPAGWRRCGTSCRDRSSSTGRWRLRRAVSPPHQRSALRWKSHCRRKERSGASRRGRSTAPGGRGFASRMPPHRVSDGPGGDGPRGHPVDQCTGSPVTLPAMRWTGTGWKMNTTLAEACRFAEGLPGAHIGAGIRPFVIPPFTVLREVKSVLAESPVKEHPPGRRPRPPDPADLPWRQWPARWP